MRFSAFSLPLIPPNSQSRPSQIPHRPWLDVLHWIKVHRISTQPRYGSLVQGYFIFSTVGGGLGGGLLNSLRSALTTVSMRGTVYLQSTLETTNNHSLFSGLSLPLLPVHPCTMYLRSVLSTPRTRSRSLSLSLCGGVWCLSLSPPSPPRLYLCTLPSSPSPSLFLSSSPQNSTPFYNFTFLLFFDTL